MRRLWLAAQIVVAAAVVWFVGRSMADNWSEISNAGAAISLQPGALILSALIILATYAVLVWAWQLLLGGWGERLAFPAAARIWCLSNLARYIPGRIWQIAGMAALARNAGVSPWAAAGSAVVVQLLAIATGALVAGVAAPLGERWALAAAAGVIATAVVLALAWPPAASLLTKWLQRITKRDIQLRAVAPGSLLAASGVTALSWVSYGVALYFFIEGVLGSALLPPGAAIGAFTASYLVGLLMVFTPGGLGAREGALYVLLAGPLGPAEAFVVMIGSRLLMTATELVAALITLPLTARQAAGSGSQTA